MHPELFELKALVAGRLDLHRRREIDDHLGSCADCSRHYVALMLGSASPKTAEAEARQSLVSSGASVMAIAAGAGAPPAFGIDAPIIPSASPRPAPKPAAPAPALETQFPPARTQVPVSASLVDAITKLRAESEGAKPAEAAAVVETPAPVAQAPARLAPEIIEPEPESPLLAPSIFTPTPYGGVSLIHPQDPAPAAPQATQPPAPELVVTFSSTPRRSTAQRSPASQPSMTASAAPAPMTVSAPSPEYVSLAVPTMASAPASAFEITTPASSHAQVRKPALPVMAIAAAAVVLVVGIAGYSVFTSSVSKAASVAAAEAARKVEAAAVRTPAPTASAPQAPQVQTRIVYVERPSSKKGEKGETKPETVLVAPTAPIAVTLPDVNLNTGVESGMQANTQRAAASELTRSARATAIRTAVPRP